MRSGQRVDLWTYHGRTHRCLLVLSGGVPPPPYIADCRPNRRLVRRVSAARCGMSLPEGYDGSSEVPGPALPRWTLPSHCALLGSRDASHSIDPRAFSI